ncbi:hypothetical protein MSG28_005769 [Choristoneura fumiferana]|uniref:Uncharacterized protein n=1 Tax=Choristoneura fumiferana TaxID=7141 RepID=A0ACC0L1A2_CHOFU|nr:hypothetical protein MSG28_005769 [Choristoneura fumiferana]
MHETGDTNIKVTRCGWLNQDPLYITYHDEEWGVPQYDSQKLFEMLCLEGQQAGLSWITILKKRQHYREVFHNFDALKISKFTAKNVERLSSDPGIVRHKGKIEAIIHNSKCFLEMEDEEMALVKFCVPLLTRTVRICPVARQAQKIHRWVAPTLMELKRREKKLGGKKINPRNTFLEWNLEAELYAFGKRLNEDFDSDLLLQAFTDRTYVIKEEMKQKELEFDLKMKDNRVLAEEGEKFMKEYVQLYLEAALPKFPLEGVAGVWQHLTSEATLANVSAHLGTKDIILAAGKMSMNTGTSRIPGHCSQGS